MPNQQPRRPHGRRGAAAPEPPAPPRPSLPRTVHSVPRRPRRRVNPLSLLPRRPRRVFGASRRILHPRDLPRRPRRSHIPPPTSLPRRPRMPHIVGPESIFEEDNFDLPYFIPHAPPPPIIPSNINEHFQLGAEAILGQMNMENTVLNSGVFNRNVICDTFVDSPTAYNQLIQLAELRWSRRTRIDRLASFIRHLPVGFQLRPCLIDGWTVGSLLHELKKEGINSGLISGLYLTGRVHNFKNYSRIGQPQHINPNLPDVGFFTPKHVYQQVIDSEIQYFPLTKIYSIKPTYLDERETSFSDYLLALKADEGGSDLNTYLCWDNCTIARASPSRVSSVVNLSTTACRTAGLGNVLFKPFMTILDDNDTILYIPDGYSNCFLKCVEKGIYFEKIRKKLLTGVGVDISDEKFKEFKVEASTKITNVIQSIPKPKRKNAKQEKLGLSMRKLNLIAIELLEHHNIAVYLFYKNNNGEFKNKIALPEYNEQDPRFLKLSLFHLDDVGKILSPNRQNIDVTVSLLDEEHLSSGLTHAAIVFPFYNPDSNDMIDIESICELHFKKSFDLNNLRAGESWFLKEEHLQELCNYQVKRYSDLKTKTLIFDWPKKKIPPKKQTENDKNPPYIVFAYDLETVTNSTEIQDRVFEPFRSVIPPNHPFPESLDPIGYQIPFSAQWVPINLCDEEDFLNMKMDKRLTPYEYFNVPSFMAMMNIELQQTEYFVECYGNYVLDLPYTCYGDYKLGKCVEDMLVSIATFCFDNGASKAYAFAHNGAAFDAMVVLRFNRFKIVRILKTKRGILSVTIKVPLNDGKDSVLVTLRDTRLHVPGSLHDLCVGFNVPKKWAKLDFPIEQLDAYTCYDPEVIKIAKPYGENDVLALAYIIKKINLLIGNSIWKPADPLMDIPPICQFLTCMSMIRKSTINHFITDLKLNVHQPNFTRILPKAVDVPGLRCLFTNALLGGRTNAYAKSYSSPYFEDCIHAYLNNDTEELKELYKKIRNEYASMVTIDATSLYPTAQSTCPMPTGNISYIDRETAIDHINAMECVDCDACYGLCPKHCYNHESKDLRPFSIIVVKNFEPTEDMRNEFRCMIGRKLLKDKGLEYTLETSDEIRKRYNDGDIISNVVVLSNIDLYWAYRQGFNFDVIGGYTYEVSMIYSSFITPAFQQRIEEKRKGNKLLSNFLKLNYNGAYGITTQKDITTTGSMIGIPNDMLHCHVWDNPLRSYAIRHTQCDGSEFLTGESFSFPSSQLYVEKKKFPHVSEFYCNQSPNQLGIAVLSYARHIMNLLMFNIPYEQQTYTDTDSICVSDQIYENLRNCLTRTIIDESFSAPMGSFKNDHGDNNGTEPRIIFSLIATKKVKMHVTINAEGGLKIFNTFKGFNPSLNNNTPQKFSRDYADYVCSKTIVELNQWGSASPATVTSWKRSLMFGVSISDHLQHFDSKTYLSHSKGTKISKQNHGITEFFIPLGCNIKPDYAFIHNADDDSYDIDVSRSNDLPTIWGFVKYPPTYLTMFIEKYYAPHTTVNVDCVDEQKKLIFDVIARARGHY